MSFLSIVSPISNKSVRNIVSPISNEGFRDFIADTTAIGNPTLQKIGLQMAGIAAQVFLPPGMGEMVNKLCGQLAQKVGDKQQQEALMAQTLKGLPADQQATAGQFMTQFQQLLKNPDFQKQLAGMNQSTSTAPATSGNGMSLSSLSLPPSGSPSGRSLFNS